MPNPAPSVAELGAALRAPTVTDGAERLSIRTRETPDTLKLQVKAVEQAEDSQGVEVKTADTLIKIGSAANAATYDEANTARIIGFVKSKARPGTKYEILLVRAADPLCVRSPARGVLSRRDDPQPPAARRARPCRCHHPDPCHRCGLGGRHGARGDQAMIAALLRKAAPRPAGAGSAAGPATGSNAMEKKLRSECRR